MSFRKFCLPSLIFFAASALVCSAQTKALANTDVSLDGFYQTTSTASGNGISVKATHSAGGAAFLRHSYHWWLGFEGGYAVSRYTNYYTGQVFGVQTNMHEASGSYLIQGPHALGIQPFATAGGERDFLLALAERRPERRVAGAPRHQLRRGRERSPAHQPLRPPRAVPRRLLQDARLRPGPLLHRRLPRNL